MELLSKQDYGALKQVIYQESQCSVVKIDFYIRLFLYSYLKKKIININCSQNIHFQNINDHAELFEIWHNIVPVCTDKVLMIPYGKKLSILNVTDRHFNYNSLKFSLI